MHVPRPRSGSGSQDLISELALPVSKILTASTKSQETALALIHEESRQVKGENIRTHMKN